MGFKNFLHLFDGVFDFKDKENRNGVNSVMSNEFMNSISFDENPFEGETPDMVRVYDVDGNEVDC